MHDAGEVLQRDVVYFTTGTSFSKMRCFELLVVEEHDDSVEWNRERSCFGSVCFVFL